jgi:hypothetical protein
LFYIKDKQKIPHGIMHFEKMGGLLDQQEGHAGCPSIHMPDVVDEAR